MLELEEARQRILSTLSPLGAESIALTTATGRILAAPATSPLDLPPFDNSAMDGYAVQSADLATAGLDQPVPLQLRGRVAAGEVFDGAITSGSCVRLFTGSPLPAGADAVVMQEDTRVDATRPTVIWFHDTVKPWENVRFRGEDVKRSATMANAGDALTVGRVGLLAAVGLDKVVVGVPPQVALLATGSELIEGGRPPAPGKIYESNRAMLAALVRQAGGVPIIFPLVEDTLTATRNALRDAAAQCHVVVTAGGVSVGEFDFVKQAFEELGGELAFWRVAIKPGKPFVFGRSHGKFLFGLPGNPVSALVTFLLLVRPALRRLQGATDPALPKSFGVLVEPLENPGDRRHFVRVFLDEHGRVRSTGAQASHILSSLAQANALVDVPPHATLPVGATVPVIRWEV
jgi:molybdopterin molybdotransferase